jgi:hypothetical protein
MQSSIDSGAQRVVLPPAFRHSNENRFVNRLEKKREPVVIVRSCTMTPIVPLAGYVAAMSLWLGHASPALAQTGEIQVYDAAIGPTGAFVCWRGIAQI